MKKLLTRWRTFALLFGVVLLAGTTLFVALRSGPLAPVPVTVTTVQKAPLSPALFGVGTIEARYTYKLGPLAPGRVKQVGVHVGDTVKAGQLLAEIDPVDLDRRVEAQDAALRRAAASSLSAEAQVKELTSRRQFAEVQARRSEKLFEQHSLSEEAVDESRQARDVAEAALSAAIANLDALRQDMARMRAERAGLLEQRATLALVAPVDGIVIARHLDPGSTAVAGQAVVELIDPNSLWVSVRFDQLGAAGLRAGLSASIALRSHAEPFPGRVLRIEPTADAVTEEILAKVVFDARPDPLPPLGELGEVTVQLPQLPAKPTVPNASIVRIDGQPGVWAVADDALRFAPIELGASDLDGRVQIRAGLDAGQRVVLHSLRALTSHHRIQVVSRLPGVTP